MAHIIARIPFSTRLGNDNPFLDPGSHLSLGEINRRTELAAHRRKLLYCGVALTEAEAQEWDNLNRVPRRPPIYGPRLGAA